MMHAAHDDHDGNRVLENQLLLIIRLEHKGVLIEALNSACELYPAKEVDSNDSLFLARIVEKTILNILRRFIHLQILARKIRVQQGGPPSHCSKN